MIDVVSFTQQLIQCPSVTPVEAGALSVLEHVLKPLGFECYRLPFGEGEEHVENLFAYRPGASKHLAFAGHTDVVPIGQMTNWHHDPFKAEIENGILYGRGAVDMKGGIAAFISAISACIQEGQELPTLSLIITGDEEGASIHGTQKMLPWIESKGLIPDYCLVGEPTSEIRVGDTLKVGRRGSVNMHITAYGQQGHVAYADIARNPIPSFLQFLTKIQEYQLDHGYENFQPSHLEITSVDVDNPTHNIIPAEISARLNIRFNPNHTGEDLVNWVREQADRDLKKYTLSSSVCGEAFYCPDTELVHIVQTAVAETTGAMPVPKTTGGTSDARFIYHYCPVVELGLNHKSAHHANEHVSLDDLYTLKAIYQHILKSFVH